MITFNDFTDGYKSICTQFFVFGHKDHNAIVSYSVKENYEFELSKLDLVCCINYFISRLKKLGYGDAIDYKSYRFVDYEYFELVVYLNALLRFYTEKLGLPKVPLFTVAKASRLPVDVSSVRPLLIVDYALLFDELTSRYRCLAHVNGYFYHSEDVSTLIDDIRSTDPDLFFRYNVSFRNSGHRA